MIGPAAMFLRVALESGSADSNGTSSLKLEAELVKLCIAQTARFWKIGCIFLGKVEELYAAVGFPNLIQTLQTQ